MFGNLDWWHFGALLLVAVLIFGERLPKVISDGMRMLRGLRAMAQAATDDLSRELGTDIQLQDLHPKAFIRKHLLSEEDEAAIRQPLQSLLADVKQDVEGVRTSVNDLASTVDPRKPVAAPEPATAPRSLAQRLDFDAT